MLCVSFGGVSDYRFTINNLFGMILVTNIYTKYHYYNFLSSSPPSPLSPMSTFSTCTHFAA